MLFKNEMLKKNEKLSALETGKLPGKQGSKSPAKKATDATRSQGRQGVKSVAIEKFKGEIFKEKDSGKSIVDVSKEASRAWKALPQNEQEEFKKRARNMNFERIKKLIL